jgi:DNA-binding CsgD family transcriptional regulator
MSTGAHNNRGHAHQRPLPVNNHTGELVRVGERAMHESYAVVVDALTRGVVGRDGEFVAASEFLDSLDMGPAALVFVGEPGIGKTTLWRTTVELEQSRGCRVLKAQPAEAEAQLAFAVLADLVEPVFESVVAELPEPQRHGLAVALLREAPGPDPLDPRAVSAAMLSVLRLLAAKDPVLMAIDDLQWIDRASARVLDFVVRRLDGMPVGVVACERISDHGTRVDLRRALPRDRYTRLRLGPLSLGALHQILKQQLGRSFPRRTLVRLQDESGGNPFFALELGRSLPEDGSTAQVLALPENLRRLVDNRLAALSGLTQEVLLAASALRLPTIDIVSSVTPGRSVESLRALERAAAAGVISIDGPRIRFAHPLFAAGVYTSAPPQVRRLVHRRLAPLVEEIEERARHLALGAEGPDERLAVTVAEAAEHARRRGAPDVGAELLEHAVALTPQGQALERQRRSIQAAEYQFHAGELRRARQTLEALLPEIPAGPERANALRLLGEIRYQQDSFVEGIGLLEEALRHVGEEHSVESAIELRLAFGTLAMADYSAAARHAHRALDFAEHVDESASLAEALASVAILDLLNGRGLDPAKIDRALRLENPHHQIPFMMRPSRVAGFLAFYAGHLTRSDELLAPLRQRILETGEESDLPYADSYLVWSACWRGDLDGAACYADEGIEAAARTGSDSLQSMALGFAALPPAYAGDVVLVRNRATECLALASRTGRVLSTLWANWATALLALSQDDPRAADAALGPLSTIFEQQGVSEPIRAFFLPDEIQALIALGKYERAERLLAVFEEAALRLERRWALMLAYRCRALLLAARGDLDGASAAAGEALARCDGLELRIEVARTFLVAGTVERRRRGKRRAAGHLQQALELFDHVGARLWAQRARAELDRVGQRTASSIELTVSETRVAQLTASGLTNREVAAQLFISPKTVEANLARIYRKLNIRSRAELGARLESIGTIASRT